MSAQNSPYLEAAVSAALQPCRGVLACISSALICFVLVCVTK